MWAGEGVVNRNPIATFFVLREKREIHNPEEVKLIGVLVEFHHYRALGTDTTENRADALARTGGEEDDIALFEVHLSSDSIFLRIREDLPQRALVFAVLKFDEEKRKGEIEK